MLVNRVRMGRFRCFPHQRVDVDCIIVRVPDKWLILSRLCAYRLFGDFKRDDSLL